MDDECGGRDRQCLLAPFPDDLVKAHILPHILMTRPLLERMRLLATLRCVALAWKKTIDDTEELYYAAIELEQEEEEFRMFLWLNFVEELPSSDDGIASD